MLDVTQSTTIRFAALDLAAALKKVRIAISTEKTRYYLNGVYVERDRADAKFSVSATLPCEAPAEPFEIGFNVAFVRDVLAALDGQDVTLNVADMGSPARFAGYDPNELHVVMPMRV